LRQTKIKNAKKKNISGHSVGKLRVTYEQFEDTKGVIRTRKSNKGRRYNGKGQTLIYKTLHRKLRIEQHETHKNPGKTCSICDIRRVTLVTNQVTSHE
jgi:hypothetical protein